MLSDPKLTLKNMGRRFDEVSFCNVMNRKQTETVVIVINMYNNELIKIIRIDINTEGAVCYIYLHAAIAVCKLQIHSIELLLLGTFVRITLNTYVGRLRDIVYSL